VPAHQAELQEAQPLVLLQVVPPQVRLVVLLVRQALLRVLQVPLRLLLLPLVL